MALHILTYYLQCAQDNFITNECGNNSDVLERQMMLNFQNAGGIDSQKLCLSQHLSMSENIPVTTNIILQQIGTECNGLRKESFLSPLM